MEQKETTIAFWLSLVGAILIILCGLSIALNGAPVVLASYPAYSLSQINGTGSNASGLWVRVALGLPGYADSSWLLLWMAFGVLCIVSSMLLLIQPKRHGTLGPIIIACSLLSIPIGGGFILGFILSIIGGLAAIEWPKPIKETFVGKFVRVFRLDSSLFHDASKEPKYLSTGVWILVLANVLSGIGYGIYATTLNAMTSESARFAVLFLGQVNFDISVFSYPLIYIGTSILKWMILSVLVYVVGTKLIGGKGQFNEIAAVAAFAYAPVTLQIFLPLVFSNQPTAWGLILFFVTNIWMIIALLVGLRQTLEISIGRTLGIILFCGGTYWIIDYLGLVTFLQIPGVWFILSPATFVLALFSIGTIIAILTGTFSRREALE